MEKKTFYSNSFTDQVKWVKHLSLTFKLCAFVFLILISSKSFAQTFPAASSCTSKDLELISATLPPNLGESVCDCDGTRTLVLGIRNKTGSTRTSFALWGTLHRYGADGVEIGTGTPIFACAGPIIKNSDNFLPATSGTTTITVNCGESIDITGLYLAWTSASPGETCATLAAHPELIAPKCGTLPLIHVGIGVDATFTVVSATCSGGTSSITTNPFGGKTPYSYSWGATAGGTVPAGQQTSKDLTGLTPGTYTVTITDANGCTAAKSRVITNPSALALGECIKTDVSCFGGSDGSVTAGAVTNAVGTVIRSWKNSSNVEVGTTATVTNLPAGVYTFRATDDCSFRTCSVTIGGPSAALSSTETHTNVVCFQGSTGAIDLSPSGGTPAYAYSWTASNGGVIPPGQANNQDLTGLVAGTYDVVITDSKGTSGGCRATKQVVITQPAAGLALGTCSKTNATCTTGGSVSAGTVTGSVGTVNYSWKNSLDEVVGTSSSVSDLPADTYTLTVTDNCSSKTCNVTIAAASALPAPSVCIVQPNLCGSSGSVTVTSPIGTDFQYSIDNGSTWQSSNVFPNLGAGSVTGIKVKSGDCISPAADCAASACGGGGSARTTQTVVSTETMVIESVGIKAYPNPFNDRVKFVITATESGYGSLDVMNMLGQKVKTVFQGQIHAGTQTFEMSVPQSRVATLLYILRMNGKQVTGKLIQRN